MDGDKPKKRRNRRRRGPGGGGAGAAASGAPAEDDIEDSDEDMADSARPASSASLVARPDSSATVNTVDTDGGERPHHLSDVKFSDLVERGIIDKNTGRAIKERLGFEYLTHVQEKTLFEILNGDDCLAKAKTGTGKTMGFLVPSVERLCRQINSGGRIPPATAVSVLIISPTRELAIQIATEAESLLAFHPFKVQCVVGGTNMKTEARALKSSAPSDRNDILVATPGRLLDHLQNSGLQQQCSDLQVLIFDEADRLLDQGFRKDLERIIALLPARTQQKPRQTLMFSATIPDSVHQVASLALLPTRKFISTVSESEDNTHAHVDQLSLVVPDALDILPAFLGALEDLEKVLGPNEFKVIVFFPTARGTQLGAELLQALNRWPVFEIHSRKSQGARNSATERFRESSRAVLCSSDVSARGMDFPGVGAVVQVGLPSSREQYVHRLGRTARAGAAGVGLLVLGAFEAFFVGMAGGRGVKGLPVKRYPGTESILSPQRMDPLRNQVRNAMAGKISPTTKAQAYQAWLGYYKDRCRDIGWRPEELVARANAMAIDGWLCNGVPELQAKTVGMMGLKGTPGLNVVSGGG
ncbi:hypothetical protein HK101_005986, partial [Irineochytrium annulatum]